MTRRTPLDLDNERQSLRLSNTSRERRIAAEHARERTAIEDAWLLLRRNGYHVINSNGAIDTGVISSILGDWYHAEIHSIADAIIRDVRVARGVEAPRPREYVTDEIARESDEDEIREWVSERVDEDTDSHEYVIYTYKARLVLLASDNESAYEDEIGDSTGATVEARACMAMRADVLEVLHAREDEWLTCDGPDEDPDPDNDSHDEDSCPCPVCYEARTRKIDNMGHCSAHPIKSCTTDERESDEAIEERERTDPGGNGTPEDAAAVRAEIAARQRGRDDAREREHAEIVRAREHAQDE